MKTLIIYSTKGGVSRQCAEMLADKLSPSIEVDIYDIQDNPPSPEDFDVAVIGGSIRMGALNKKLRAYLKANASALSNMPTAIFMCCGFTESFDDYVKMQISPSITASLGVHCFGGELKPEKLKGLDKLIVRIVRSSLKTEDADFPNEDRSPLPEIVPENIYRLADKIRELL